MKPSINSNILNNSYETRMNDDLVTSNKEALFFVIPDLDLTITLPEGNECVTTSRQENYRLDIIPGTVGYTWTAKEMRNMKIFGEIWSNPRIDKQPSDYVEDKRKAKEMKSNQIRNQTFQTVRRQSVDFENRKRHVDENITKLNQEHITEIQEFRSRLATATQSNF